MCIHITGVAAFYNYYYIFILIIISLPDRSFFRESCGSKYTLFFVQCTVLPSLLLSVLLLIIPITQCTPYVQCCVCASQSISSARAVLCVCFTINIKCASYVQCCVCASQSISSALSRVVLNLFDAFYYKPQDRCRLMLSARTTSNSALRALSQCTLTTRSALS